MNDNPGPSNLLLEEKEEGNPVLSKAQLRKRHLLGLALVLCVVLIWVSSSILIQIIFLDANFDKPFFLTYLSTSLFSVYLFGFAFNWKRWTTNPGFPSKKYSTLIEQAQNRVDEDSSSISLVGSTNATSDVSGKVKMSVYEVIKLSALFCPIWFIANYTYNLGLSMTSVSSNTILSTLSGVFALITSSAMGVDRFSVWKLFAAIITLGGVALVSEVDTRVGKDSVMGDVYTVVGAIMYAFYCTLLKKKIVHEERLEMPMFFGFMGLINLLILWPFMLIWNALQWEPFELPSAHVWLALVVNGLIGTVLSDILEAWSILLTTPLINTLGLSLTIPIAMISDIVRGVRTFPPLYYLGSFFVFVGFVLVNLSSGTFEERFLRTTSRAFSGCTRLLPKRKSRMGD